MAVLEVKLTGSLSPARMAMSAGEISRHLDDGNTVLVSVSGDPGSGSVYVWRNDDGLKFDPASMWPPRWQLQLERILTNMEQP